MRPSRRLFALAFLASIPVLSTAASAQTVDANYGKLPLSFEANQGQTESTTNPSYLMIFMKLIFGLLFILFANHLMAQTTTTTINVGKNPVSVAVNPVTNKIYVASLGLTGMGAGSKSVTVIDGATNGTTSIPMSDNPYAIAVNTATNKIYVANNDPASGKISVIDGATNKTTDIAPGVDANSSTAIAVNSTTNKIYVANSGSNNMTIINGVDNTYVTLPISGLGIDVPQIAINPVTNKIYVCCGYSDGYGTVIVIDGVTNHCCPAIS
jgi:DNA-binding beta-propeller fold protein YncE